MELVLLRNGVSAYCGVPVARWRSEAGLPLREKPSPRPWSLASMIETRLIAVAVLLLDAEGQVLLVEPIWIRCSD
jgi:hypothetical protein